LYVHGNQDITSIDTGNNPAIYHMMTFGSSITSLDVSNNPALKTLGCGSPVLTSVKFGQNSALESLDISFSSSNLTDLDLSTLTSLLSIIGFDADITSLDISNNTALQTVMLDGSSLTDLDVGNNTALLYVGISGNDFSSDALKGLFADLPQRTADDMAMANCAGNPGSGELTAADIRVATDKNWDVVIQQEDGGGPAGIASCPDARFRDVRSHRTHAGKAAWGDLR
jgi:hypothetical protein